MKTNLQLFFTLCLLLGVGNLLAQSPVSGFFQGKGQNTTTLSYTFESYDEVFLVPTDISGVPIFEEVNVQSISVYNVTGLSDQLDLVVSLPYIRAEGAASEAVLQELSFDNVRKGIQDLSIYLNYRPMTVDFDRSTLHFLVSGGFEAPLGDYKVDEGLQSIIAIGNRATSVTAIGGAHWQTNKGLFLTTQIGYSLRNDRVPNALLGEAKVGYAGAKIYADLWLAGQTSDGGTNILAEGFDGFFPATDVSYHRLGANVFVPLGAGIGVGLGFNTYLSGRNVGQSTGISTSITYQLP